MRNDWHIRDEDKRLTKTRKIVKMYALEHEITIAEALAEIVEKHVSQNILSRTAKL